MEYRSAGFVLYKDRVLDRYDKLKVLGVSVSYSWKTNPEVGKVLEQETDSFFSIHSLNELNHVIDTKRVWYFLLASSYDEIKTVLSKGVVNFVVNLEDDIERLLELSKKAEIIVNLLLRINIKELTIFTGRYYVFGIDSKRVQELIILLRTNQNIRKLGVHFHRKTQNVSEWNLKNDIQEFLEPAILKVIDIINIGGGIPGKYKNTNDRALDIVFRKIKELKEWSNKEIIVEPGRYIASHAVDLESNIVAIQGNTIFVNCSVYNGALDTFVANVKLLVDGELTEGKKWVIKGCTPASEDILRYEVFLENPRVGDTIRFLNAGAYNYSTDFCSMEKLKTVEV